MMDRHAVIIALAFLAIALGYMAWSTHAYHEKLLDEARLQLTRIGMNNE